MISPSAPQDKQDRSDISICFLGDVLIAGRAIDALHRDGPEMVARRVWGPAQGADVILLNLEAPITTRSSLREDKLFNHKSPPEILELFDERFILGLANNHILDYGEPGLADTMEALEARGIRYTGAGSSIHAARRPAIARIRDTTLGVLCATDPRFQSATTTAPGTFPAEPQILQESILALAQEVDLVIVSIHAGIEFYRLPSPRQMALAELCLESGAQVVAFHHSHCTSGVWSDNRGIVLFGMGDYVFPAPSRPTLLSRHESAAWHVTFAAPAFDETKVQPHPVVLDRDGLPADAVGVQSQRILDRIDRYSHRLKDGRVGKWWHLLELLRPGHLWVNIHRTTHNVRRRGVRVTLKNLVEGLRLQYR